MSSRSGHDLLKSLKDSSTKTPLTANLEFDKVFKKEISPSEPLRTLKGLVMTIHKLDFARDGRKFHFFKKIKPVLWFSKQATQKKLYESNKCFVVVRRE